MADSAEQRGQNDICLKDARVDSEFEALRLLVLAAPDHFQWTPNSDVSRERLQRGHKLDRVRAMSQHAVLRKTLIDLGVACLDMPLDSRMPDQVFVRDPAIMTPWGLIVSRMATPERCAEPAMLQGFLESRGVPIWYVSTTEVLEGGDVQVLRPGLAAIGYSASRTSRRAARDLAAAFDREGWTALLTPVPDQYVHLDVIFGLIDTDLAVACVDALQPEFLELIDRQGIEIVPVTSEEATALACNFLTIAPRRIVMAASTPRVAAALRLRGVEVYEIELDELLGGGGGVHCMTMPVVRRAAKA